MAKKKTKKKGQPQQQKMSPERFLREKGRQLPLDKCYMTSDWQERGMALVMVTRRRPSGKIVMGFFEVDTYCFGVKDAMYRVDMDDDDVKEMIKRLSNNQELVEVSYPEAHNMIYGSIEFAAEGDLKPAPEFNYAKYVLEEDTDDVPLIDYEFGKDGKHLIIEGPRRNEMQYYPMLVKKLGKENVRYNISTIEGFQNMDENNIPENDYDDDDDDFDIEDLTEERLKSDKKLQAKIMKTMMKMCDQIQEDRRRYPSEKYSYEHPEYPKTLEVKHAIIGDELLSPANYKRLPDEVIKQILELPADEAARDLGNVILYVIGQTYKGIEDDTIEAIPHNALMLALILLPHIPSDGALDALTQFIRQSDNFHYYHLGDLTDELIVPALYRSALNHTDKLEELLDTPGIESNPRSAIASALAMIAVQHPERRGEIIEIFRRKLKSMAHDLPLQHACDGTFAGLMMSDLIKINAQELIPEIELAFASGGINPSICGDAKQIADEMKHPTYTHRTDSYSIPDIYEQSEQYAGFITPPDEAE